MTKISASIINWNNREHIIACLDSLLCQEGVALDVVVLDNGSRDGSCELVKQKFSKLRIVENARNLGFAAAHNIGFRATTGEWHLVLNSDVILNPDYIRQLLNICVTDPKAGAASGKLLRLSPAGDGDIIDSTGIEIYQSRFVWDRGTREPDRGQFERGEQVFGCCGAAALYRRAALSQLCPDGEIFPEIYFAYYEDVDLAWRLNLAGWHCLYVPQAVARHARGGSTRGSATTRRWVFRNRYVLLARNDRRSEMVRALRPILSFEGIQLLRMIRYPGLILRVPGIIWSVLRALGQRRAMKQSGRCDFGLSMVPNLVSPGSGVDVWLSHSRAGSTKMADLT